MQLRRRRQKRRRHRPTICISTTTTTTSGGGANGGEVRGEQPREGKHRVDSEPVLGVPELSNAAKSSTWAASGWKATASRRDLRRWAASLECGGQPLCLQMQPDEPVEASCGLAKTAALRQCLARESSQPCTCAASPLKAARSCDGGGGATRSSSVPQISSVGCGIGCGGEGPRACVRRW